MDSDSYASRMNEEANFNIESKITASQIRNDDFILRMLKSSLVGICGRLMKNCREKESFSVSEDPTNFLNQHLNENINGLTFLGNSNAVGMFLKNKSTRTHDPMSNLILGIGISD